MKERAKSLKKVKLIVNEEISELLSILKTDLESTARRIEIMLNLNESYGSWNSMQEKDHLDQE